MNILIINLHSALNLGDDAIMHVTLNHLRKTFINSRITAAANDPGSWRKYPEIDVVSSLCTWMGDCKLGHFLPKFSLIPLYLILLTVASISYRSFRINLLFGSEEQKRLLKAYYDSNLILSCGGGNFYAYRPVSPSLILGLFSLAFALMLGKKTVMLPQSTGPIEGKIQRLLAKIIFTRVSSIMVREAYSKDFINNVLQVKKDIILLPDLAFGLPTLNSDQDQPNHKTIRKDSCHIGLTVIDRGAQKAVFNNQYKYENLIESLLVHLHKKYGAHIHLFSQCNGPSSDQDDRIIARKIFQRMRGKFDEIYLHEDMQDALEIRAAYKTMDFIIGTRFHTAIFALSCAVPVILIGYQPKARGTMELLGLGKYFCEIENLDIGQLSNLVEDMMEHYDFTKKQFWDIYTNAQELLRGWTAYLGFE